jgi:hypothetical protein
MLTLISGSFFAVAALAIVGGLMELRTALRLLQAKKGKGDHGLAAVDAVVTATDGVLESPLLKHRCVMFSLTLLRRRLHETVGAGALFFNEVRPFSLVTDEGATIAIDQKKQPVFMLGLQATEKPLPFLPQSIAGLLVQRFGRMGHVWAEEHVVRASETTLDDGANVHALVEDGVVKLLSTQPLQTLGRAACWRGAAAVVVAVISFVCFWLTK